MPRTADLEFEPADTEHLLKLLKRDTSGHSTAEIGERFAINLLGKPKDELLEIARKLEAEENGDEVMQSLLDFVGAAHDSLKARLSLVDAFLARLGVIAAVMEREEGKKSEGRSDA